MARRRAATVAWVLVSLLLVVRASPLRKWKVGTLQPNRFVETNGGCAISDVCDPCFKNDDNPPQCETWKNKCLSSLCMPLCMRNTWSAKVTGSSSDGGFNAQLAKPAAQLAASTVVMAVGCEQALGCCSEDEHSLSDYVEQRIYGGNFPRPNIPLPACQGEDRKAACSKCKVSVEAKTHNDVCDYFMATEDPSTEDESFTWAFATSKTEVPKHKSFKDRCEKMVEKVDGKLSSIKSKAENMLCGCLGCCDDVECPYAVSFANVKVALNS